MKLWRPDTCGCCVEEIYNGTDIVGMGAVITKCEKHASVPDHALYNVILDKENRPKNQTERFLLGLEGEDLGLGELDANGATIWRNGMGFNWTFVGEGENRTLQISVFGKTLTQPQKTRAQTWLDNKFGAGKVTLV